MHVNSRCYGLFVSIPHPVIIEMIGHAEYDFVIIDLEHAATNMESVEELVRAAELVGMTPLVRISKVERAEILKGIGLWRTRHRHSSCRATGAGGGSCSSCVLSSAWYAELE